MGWVFFLDYLYIVRTGMFMTVGGLIRCNNCVPHRGCCMVYFTNNKGRDIPQNMKHTFISCLKCE